MSDVKNVLIFCPKFFNYDINIRNAVQKNGYTVSLFNERPFDNIIGRALIRLGFDFFLKRQIFKYYKNIYDNIFADIDYLIVINPECITPEILEIYRNKCNNIIVYMWDSFENKPQAKNSYDTLTYFIHLIQMMQKITTLYLNHFFIQKHIVKSLLNLNLNTIFLSLVLFIHLAINMLSL